MGERIWNKDFILLIVSNFLMYITYYAVISALPIYLVTDLHASKSQVGITVAAYTIASVLIRPFSGFTLDKFSRRLVYLSALVIYSFLFAGYLVAVTITAIIILRFAQGLTWGFTTISGSTIAVDIIPESKRGEGIGYFSLSTTMAMAVGPVIGLYISNQWGYNVMFESGLMISLASLICASTIHFRKRFLVGKRIVFNVNNLFDKNSILPSINILIIMITYGGLISFIALYGREIGIHNTSLFFLIFAIGIASSRFISGREFDKNGPRRILTLCLILLILGFPLLSVAKIPAGFYASAIIIGFGIGVVFPTFSSMVNNLASNEHRGAANSTLYTSLDIGMGFGMLMAGLIAEYFSISAIFMISALVCIAGLVFFRVHVLKSYEKKMSIN
jgi:predicted MFS family arabinose efflux permease